MATSISYCDSIKVITQLVRPELPMDEAGLWNGGLVEEGLSQPKFAQGRPQTQHFFRTATTVEREVRPNSRGPR
jgi:hypothetical protein